MNNSRRDFLKSIAIGSVAITTGSPRADDTAMSVDVDEAYGVLVDTTLCLGCRKCEWACNQVNYLSDTSRFDFEDEAVFQEHRRPNSDAFTVVNSFRVPDEPARRYTIKVQCMHCLEPACVSACIVGALRKDPHGPVTYDPPKCIGCRYCLVACPFQIPAYEFDEPLVPRVRKCDFCFERVVEQGEVPACVAICPSEALRFGKREELIEAAYIRLADRPDRYFHHLYGEHEIGGTSWLYLTPAEFTLTELPELDSTPVPHLTESIQHGLFKSFIPPLLLYGLLGLVMYSLHKGDDSEVTDHE